MRTNYDHKRLWGCDEEINKKVGAMLQARRRRIGVTQRELAKKLGVTQKTISAIERGEDNLSLTKLVRYLEGLGIEMNLKIPVRKDGVSEKDNADEIYYVADLYDLGIHPVSFPVPAFAGTDHALYDLPGGCPRRAIPITGLPHLAAGQAVSDGPTHSAAGFS